MNCDKSVKQEDGKFFAEVFICPDCFEVASRLYNRAHQELKLVLVMMKDAIRMGLLQKKLQFKTPDQVKQTSKAEILSELGRLVEEVQKRNELCPPEDRE